MAKKKKKSKATKPPAAHSPKEPAQELTAIEAIFPETEAHEDRHGFNLRVLPHYDDAEINHVSLTLKFRSQHGSMSTSDTSGLSRTGDNKARLKDLLDFFCLCRDQYSAMPLLPVHNPTTLHWAHSYKAG